MIYRLGELTPDVNKATYIADSAEVIGNVTLAEKTTIWFNAVLRGDIAAIYVGENSNVQDNATIHIDIGVPCVIGDNVTIGHNAVIHSCQIEGNTIIGMGSTILNHARIAKNCIVGANSLVTHKLPYEEGCLIMGQPATIVRKLKPEEIQHIQENADHYTNNGELYKKQLQKINC